MNNNSFSDKARIIGKSFSWNTWGKIHQWHLVLPPSRPSLYHLGVIKRELDGVNRHLPVAVLGCTPELRDLLFKLGFEKIYLFDKSRSVYSQMNHIRCWSNPEVFVFGNWLKTISKYNDYFGAILSDLTSGNIPYNWQPTFYSSIADALTKEGLFIDKVLTHKGPKRKISDLTVKYSSLPFNLIYLNNFSCEFLFCSELLDIKQMVDSSLFYKILHEDCKDGPLSKFLGESSKITPYGTYWYYGKEWEEISRWYFQHLEQVKVYEEEETSPYYNNLKIILTRKRT
jgi:hypothetical protein